MNNFNIGDKVKVVDSNCYYPSYTSMEERLKVKNTPPLENFNNIEFTIIAKDFSSSDSLPNGFKIEETWVYGIESNEGDQFLFAEKGLKNNREVEADKLWPDTKNEIETLPIELSEKDKEFIEWQEWMEKVISKVYGIPKEYFKDKKQ